MKEKKIEFVWFMFFKIVLEKSFENILILSENCSFFLNLVFFLYFFLCFLEKKRTKMFFLFSLFLLFLRTENKFQK